ncbi:MAG: DNA-formamidopyrimidine glycosylase family protein [Candidatus Nanopelagicales bacterium]
MPEIPEIEGLLTYVTPRLSGSVITDVQVGAISAIKTADPPVSALRGCRVIGLQRFGKFLVLDLVDPDGSPLYLAIHLARAGWLAWSDSPSRQPVRMGRGPLAARLTFADDGGSVVGGFSLTEAGTQKRLAVYVVHDPAEVPGIARLGPDPLADTFTAQSLADILAAAGRRHLKTVLRDQSVLAGVGNAYSDEILHKARLSPAAGADSLTDEQRAALFAALESVLAQAVTSARELPPSELKDGKRSSMAVHGRTGQPCPVCGDTVREVASADSSFQYCPTCQTGGKPLADRRLSRLLK